MRDRPPRGTHRASAATELAAVLDLIHDVTEADGVLPLSEHVMLHLRYGGDAPVRNLLLRAPGR